VCKCHVVAIQFNNPQTLNAPNWLMRIRSIGRGVNIRGSQKQLSIFKLPCALKCCFNRMISALINRNKATITQNRNAEIRITSLLPCADNLLAGLVVPVTTSDQQRQQYEAD